MVGIVEVVKMVFENMLLELGLDVVDWGMVLIGGGVLFKDFDRLFVEEIGLFVIVVEDLLICVVWGGGCVLEMIEEYGLDMLVLE